MTTAREHLPNVDGVDLTLEQRLELVQAVAAVEQAEAFTRLADLAGELGPLLQFVPDAVTAIREEIEADAADRAAHG